MLNKTFNPYQNQKGQFTQQQRTIDRSPYSRLNSNNKKYSYNREIQSNFITEQPSKCFTRPRDLLPNFQRKSVTPQNRRFKYSNNMNNSKEKQKEFNDSSGRKRIRKYQYNYNRQLAINRLDEMPAMAKEIYARIQPRSCYHQKSRQKQDLGRIIGVKMEQNRTSYSQTRFDKYRALQNQKEGKKEEEQERPRIFLRPNTALNRTRDRNNFDQTLKISQQNQENVSFNVNKIRKQVDNDRRGSNEGLKTVNNRNQPIQDRSFQYNSSQLPINTLKYRLSNQEYCNIQKRNGEKSQKLERSSSKQKNITQQNRQQILNNITFMDQEKYQVNLPSKPNRKPIDMKLYQYVIKEPSAFESIFTGNTSKQIQTTDHSSQQQQQAHLKPLPRPISPYNIRKNQYQSGYFPQKRQYYSKDIQENILTNYSKNHSFSRKLNEYQNEALSKIKTINQLNNKIGQRIKNILSSIN